MPALAEPPVAAPAKGELPPNADFKGAAPGIEKSPLFAALDKHLDGKQTPPSPPSPGPSTTPAVLPKDKPESAKPAPVEKGPVDDPLSTLLTETPPPPAEKDKKPADVDFTKFDQDFPDDPEHVKNDPKANERWKGLKTTAKEAKREAARLAEERTKLENEISEIRRGTPQTAPEIEDLKKRVADYEKADAVFKLQNDPDFQNRVMAPLESAYAAIDGLIKTYKIDPTKLQAALSKEERTERNQALSKIIADADMNPLDTSDFTKTIGTVQDLEIKRVEAFEKAQVLNQSAQQEVKQREEQAAAKRTQSLEAADKDVFEKLSTKSEFIKDILSDDETALSVRKRADAWLKSVDRRPDMEVLHAYAPFLLSEMQKKMKALSAELDTYKAKYKEVIDGEPPAGGGGPRQEQQGEEKKLAPGEGVGNAVDEYHKGRR